VVETGFANDRQWLVVDDEDTFMTQRKWPALARVSVAVFDRGLLLEADGMTSLEVEIPGPGAEDREVEIWKDRCAAHDAGPAAASWFSELLDTTCRLVRLPSSSVRQVHLGYAKEGDRVGFADGFPFLLISQASLDELNRRLDEPIPMNRFRPNIVIDGCAAHAEDGWRRVILGRVAFRVAKPCARCVVTTTDQETGARGPEPLRTLATYRRSGDRVLFGQNLIHDGLGRLRIGDRVEIIEQATDEKNNVSR
jgi:uncharacterized protein YcbX